MKEKLLESGKWIKDLKWWQMIILFPTVLTILWSVGEKGFELYYYKYKGNIRLGKTEKQNVLLFQKHFREKPTVEKVLEFPGGMIEVAYYESDRATLVTRKFSNGRTLMRWLPFEEGEADIYGFKLEDGLVVVSAHAAEEFASAHDYDRNYNDYFVGKIDNYHYVKERIFLRDGCKGRYIIYAPTGQWIKWWWVIYKHRR